MKPVKGLSHLLETLQRRFDAIEKTKGSVAKGLRKSAQTKITSQTLQSTVTSRLRKISKDDPERTEKASIIIISEALASRFDEEVFNDSGFIELIDKIKKVFLTEPSVREKVERFLNSL